MSYVNPIPTDYIVNLASEFVRLGNDVVVELRFTNGMPTSKAGFSRFYLSKIVLPNSPEFMDIANQIAADDSLILQPDGPGFLVDLATPLIEGDKLADLFNDPLLNPIVTEVTTQIRNGVQRLIDTRDFNVAGYPIQGDNIYLYRIIYTYDNALAEDLVDPDPYGQLYAYATNWIITRDLNSLDALSDNADGLTANETLQIAIKNRRLIQPYQNFPFRGSISEAGIRGLNQQMEFNLKQIAHITNEAEADLKESIIESATGSSADELITQILGS